VLKIQHFVPALVSFMLVSSRLTDCVQKLCKCSSKPIFISKFTSHCGQICQNQNKNIYWLCHYAGL